MRRQRRLHAAGARRFLEIGGVVAGLALLLTPVAPALAQDPGPVVAVDGGGGGATPSPDPAPEPAPATGGGRPAHASTAPATSSSSSTSSHSSSSSSSTSTSASSSSAGASPAELARRHRAQERKRKEKARKERLRKERERERREAALLAKRTEKARRSGFHAFLTVLAAQIRAAHAALAATPPSPSVEPEQSRKTSVSAVSREASVAPAPAGSSSFAALVPILLGLLGAAMLLLGLAALPPAAARRSVLVARALEHRFEIGMLGTAVLASAAIGLLVTNLGG